MLKKQKKSEEIIKTCADCEYIYIDKKNLDWQGMPFTGFCKLDSRLKVVNKDGCKKRR